MRGGGEGWIGHEDKEDGRGWGWGRRVQARK